MITKFKLFKEQYEEKALFIYPDDQGYSRMIDKAWTAGAGKDYENKGDLITAYQNKYDAIAELEKYIKLLSEHRAKGKNADGVNYETTDDFPVHYSRTVSNLDK